MLLTLLEYSRKNAPVEMEELVKVMMQKQLERSLVRSLSQQKDNGKVYENAEGKIAVV